MKPNDIYQNDQDNQNEVSQTKGNTSGSNDSPRYRLLGESGLVEDEDGNTYDASEIDDSSLQQVSADSGRTSKYQNFGISSVLDDKANPAYWYYYYDERYCGPSREDYMEKMAKKYRESAKAELESKSEPKLEPEPAKAKSEPKPVSAEPKPEHAKPVSVKPKPVSVKPKPKSVNPKPELAKPQHEPENKPVTIDAEPMSEPLFVVSEAEREKANRDQHEVNRRGIRPIYRKDLITVIHGLNFVAIVDRDNQVIVSNEKYCNVDFYYNGLARVQNRKTMKFGFVDRHGNEVVPCVWRSAGQFSEYLVGVQDDSHKSGFVDVTGRLVIPCIWKETWGFHEGLARVQDDNNKIGMIDQRGKLVIPCVWRGMGDFSEGLASFMDDSGKCGYMDRTGEIVIPSRWKNAWTFCEGRAVVQDFNNRLGYIDKTGELVIPCRWKKANYFHNGLAKVSDSKSIFLKDKWVFIDKKGRIVDPQPKE